MSDKDAMTLAALKRWAAGGMISDAVELIERQAAEIERLTLMIPLTDEEAQRAYDEAPSVPISKERIAEIVRYVTGGDAGPIATPLEPEAGEGETVNSCLKCGSHSFGVLRGGQSFKGEDSIIFGVQCRNCGRIGETRPTRRDAILAWNQEPTA